MNAGYVSSSEVAILNNGNSFVFHNSGIVTSVTNFVLLVLGDDAQIDNSGTIQGANGINATGFATNLINSGTITGNAAVTLTGAGAVVLNAGSILGQGPAIIITGDSAVVHNVTGATLASRVGNTAMLIGTLGFLFNEGAVSGGGVRSTGDGFLLRDSGDISGGDFGYMAANGGLVGTNEIIVDNSGSITGTAGGISNDMQLIHLHNTGSILAENGSGVVSGGVADIYNTGTIGGASGFGVIGLSLQLGLGADTVRNFGILHGDAQLGGGNDFLRNGGTVDGSAQLGDGNDSYVGRGGSLDGLVFGNNGNDTITGGLADDFFDGGAGTDVLKGFAGDDSLRGGANADTLTGGAGADQFIYVSSAEIGRTGARETITDFTHLSDQIVLSSFMAGGSFIGAAAFTAANQVRYTVAAGLVEGDVNGDAITDWALLLSTKPLLTATDFIF